MFRENDELRIRLGTQRQRNLACQPKAGAAVWNPDQRITEAVSCQLLAIDSAGEIICGVGVRVIDMREWEKSVQQGLNGGTWTAWLIEAVREVVDHLAIAHALAF